MGGTLTLLIRHMVRADVESAGGWKSRGSTRPTPPARRPARFSRDFALVPAIGLRDTQFLAVGLNRRWRGLGVWCCLGRPSNVRLKPDATPRDRTVIGSVRLQPDGTSPEIVDLDRTRAAAVRLRGHGYGTRVAAALHAAAGRIPRRVLARCSRSCSRASPRARGPAASSPGAWLHPHSRSSSLQALLVVFALSGLTVNSADAINAARDAGLPEFWFNAWPMLLEISVPSLLMGASFPLGNAVIQHAERAVGRRAGVLYLATRPVACSVRSPPATCCCRASASRLPRPSSRLLRG